MKMASSENGSKFFFIILVFVLPFREFINLEEFSFPSAIGGNRLYFRSPEPTEMLKIGDVVPRFMLQDQSGKLRNVEEFLGRGKLVLFFYPKDETLGCTKEACEFRDYQTEFEEAGAEIIGISGDSVESHRQFVENRQLNFVLLSDPDYSVHRQFGCRQGLFGNIGIRVTFVIDSHGIIMKVYSSRIRFRNHVKVALDAVLKMNEKLKEGKPRGNP